MNDLSEQHDDITSPTLYFNTFNPFTKNSNTVCKFSTDGAVTNMLEYPKPTAPANVNPSAADLPYP